MGIDVKLMHRSIRALVGLQHAEVFEVFQSMPAVHSFTMDIQTSLFFVCFVLFLSWMMLPRFCFCCFCYETVSQVACTDFWMELTCTDPASHSACLLVI